MARILAEILGRFKHIFLGFFARRKRSSELAELWLPLATRNTSKIVNNRTAIMIEALKVKHQFPTHWTPVCCDIQSVMTYSLQI